MTGSGSALFGSFRRPGAAASAAENRRWESRSTVTNFVGEPRALSIAYGGGRLRTHNGRTMAAPKPIRAMNSRPHQDLHRQRQPRSGARRSASTWGCDLGEPMIRHFADGEIHLQIQENVRGADVFVIQPTCTPVDRNLMELLLHDGRAEARLCRAHHRGVTLLWVCAAGPEGQAARADFGPLVAALLETRRRGPGI